MNAPSSDVKVSSESYIAIIEQQRNEAINALAIANARILDLEKINAQLRAQGQELLLKAAEAFAAKGAPVGGQP